MKRTPKTERQGTLAESIGVFALVLAVLMYGILGLKLSAHLPLVPWGASGAFVANCFGVAASQIAPWYFVGWLMPLIGLLLGLTGIGCPVPERAES